jgi:integrase
MPLKLVNRHGSPHLYLRGTIRGISVDESTGLSDCKRAQEVLTLRSAEIMNRSVFGDKATRTFAEAATSYMEGGGEGKHLAPILNKIGLKPLAAINLDVIHSLARELKPNAKPSTVNRQVYTPISAVLHHAARKGWCAIPVLARPSQPEGRVRCLTHAEADRLIRESGHLAPLVTFLFCTGVRLSEALKLDWANIDLARRHVAILNRGAGGPGTKNKLSRGLPLHTRVLAAFEALPHREGRVFRVHYGNSPETVGPPYADRNGAGGGEIKTGWAASLRRAGLKNFRVHDTRHTWASWHYAANRDLTALMELGGWKTIKSVLRYMHTNSDNHADSIERTWEDAVSLPAPTTARQAHSQRAQQ